MKGCKREAFLDCDFHSEVADFQARALERSWKRSGNCEHLGRGLIPRHIPDREIAVGTALGATPQ